MQLTALRAAADRPKTLDGRVNLHKLTYAIDEGGPVLWPHMYRTEETTGPDRLVIAPREEPLKVMCDLAEAIGPELFVLYVHSVARGDSPPGRFE